MRPHYILIDLENVHHDCSRQLVGNPFKVFVFVGAKQPKVSVETAAALQPLGKQVEYITISGSGPNALDFHIAFYIGQISQSDPSAAFRIVSNDKGFDPLIRHLKSRQIDAKRVGSPATARRAKPASDGTLTQRMEAAISFLKRVKASRPKTLEALCEALSNAFKKKLPDKDIERVVNQLIAKKHVIVSGEQLSYNLSGT